MKRWKPKCVFCGERIPVYEKEFVGSHGASSTSVYIESGVCLSNTERSASMGKVYACQKCVENIREKA